MAGSTLDPDNIPAGKGQQPLPGHDTRTLGPSDSSDSGSDMAGAGASVGDVGMDSDSDRVGTGEHTTAGREPDIAENGDIGTDRIVGAEEAGLGGGLDQAEEAQLGKTDEPFAAERRHRERRKG